MKVSKITQTCWACPSQWEGNLDDGRMFYARYRWGGLTIRLSDNPTNSLSNLFENNEIVCSETLGDGYDGVLEQEMLVKIMEKNGFSF
jgi:hypothetical protein